MDQFQSEKMKKDVSTGFIHSIKLPQAYKKSAKVLERFMNRQGSIKTLVLQGNYKRMSNIILRTTTLAAQRHNFIKRMLNEIDFFLKEPRYDPFVAVILASEMIKNGKPLVGKSEPANVINMYAEEILYAYSQKDPESLENEIFMPKYARINTLKVSIEDVHYELTKLRMNFLPYDRAVTKYREFVRMVKRLQKDEYMEDYHMENVLVFPPSQAFGFMNLYKYGDIIIQNKASCIPVHICGAKPGINAIDACSAPGNKTTHLAAVMQNEGTITAVELDRQRVTTLRELVHLRGATCVKVVHEDFTLIERSENVDLILVDPSCSASGTDAHKDEISAMRIRKLSSMQFRLLRHALLFPNVKTVIYSTCSINEEENEQVVEKAMEEFKSQFKVKDLSTFFPEWKATSLTNYKCGPRCIRTNPSKHLCQGFFVAKFGRRKKRKLEMSETEPSDSLSKKVCHE